MVASRLLTRLSHGAFAASTAAIRGKCTFQGGLRKNGDFWSGTPLKIRVKIYILRLREFECEV